VRRPRPLALAAAALGALGAVVAALLPLQSSADGRETALAAAGDSGVALLIGCLALAAAPALAPEPSFRWLVWVCGIALVAASFFTAVAVPFIPAGLALLAASWALDRRR